MFNSCSIHGEIVKSYYRFILELGRLVRTAGRFPPGRIKAKPQPKPAAKAPKALIFSPHPDDECIVGGLALRLLHEARWNVINIPVTFGSNRRRRTARRRELARACAQLGFDLVTPGERCLERIDLETRKTNRPHWRAAVSVIADILAEHHPRVIFFPHERDWHRTHIGTHFLVMDALKTMPAEFKCHVVETEFWGQMNSPNLLVESGGNDVTDLVAALACHVGEVRRNPYHVLLPAWMLDNVRRAEIVGGPGVTAPDFTFATIYRLRKWRRGRMVNSLVRGKFLSKRDNPSLLFT